jgi:hypothetical protein
VVASLKVGWSGLPMSFKKLLNHSVGVTGEFPVFGHKNMVVKNTADMEISIYIKYLE